MGWWIDISWVVTPEGGEMGRSRNNNIRISDPDSDLSIGPS